MSDARSRSPFCRCEYPERAKTRDDVAYCKTCEGLLPDNQDEMLAMLTRTMVRMSRQLDALTARGEGGVAPAEPLRSIPPVRDFSPRGSEVPTNDGLIGPNELARRLGRSPEWVRAHRDELGVIPLGDGPRPRLWFDWAEVERRLAAESPAEARIPKRRSGRRRQAELLDVKR
jgi:hypothetical protein